MGEKGLPLVERAFATGHPELQMQAVRAAGRIGEKGLPLVKRAFDSGDPELQVEAVLAAGSDGRKRFAVGGKSFCHRPS